MTLARLTMPESTRPPAKLPPHRNDARWALHCARSSLQCINGHHSVTKSRFETDHAEAAQQIDATPLSLAGERRCTKSTTLRALPVLTASKG